MSTFNEADHPRQSDGKFTDKPQSAPEVSPLRAQPVYTITAENGDQYVVRARNADEALMQYLSGLDPQAEGTYPASVTDDSETPSVLVLMNRYGDAHSLEEHRRNHSNFDGWEASLEPLIEVGEEPVELEGVRTSLADGFHPVTSVELSRTDSGLSLDITTSDNLLWNELFTPEELDEHRDIVDAVYGEWFGATISGDSWDELNVTMSVPVQDGEQAETILISKGHDQVANFINKTDPGTFGSRYVGHEIRRRIDERVKAKAVQAV